MFSLNAFIKSFHALALGVPSTLIVSLLGIAIGLLVGALICAGALSLSHVLRRGAAVWISFFRGVPLMVQLLLMFYLLPVVGINVPPMVAAVLAVGLCSSAYVAEIWRGAINALPRGQRAAATALGLTTAQTYRYVLLPMAFRIILPPLTSEFLSTIKNTSVAITIGLIELTAEARAMQEFSFQVFEAFTAATILYLLVNIVVVIVMRFVERGVAVPGYISGK